MSYRTAKNLIILILLFQILIYNTKAYAAEIGDSMSNSSNAYSNPVFKDVILNRDIIFGEVMNSRGIKEKLLLDVYMPGGDASFNRPVIVWLHGGGFTIGEDKSQAYMVNLANTFAKRGFVCISINYRVRSNPDEDSIGTLQDAVDDAMLAIDWIRNNSIKYGIDKSRIIVSGGSAGGKTGANLCYKDTTQAHEWNKDGIIAFIDLWGSPSKFLSLYKIDKNDPATLIIHGTEDKTIPFSQSEELANDLKSNEIYYELYPIIGAGHSPIKNLNNIIDYISSFLNVVLNNVNVKNLNLSSLHELLDVIKANPSNEDNYKKIGELFHKDNRQGIMVFCDGKIIDFSKYNNVLPTIEDGSTLIPVRAMAEGLGAEVQWDGETNKVSIFLNGKAIELILDSRDALVDGKNVLLDKPATSIDGRIMIPLRFVGEAFSKKVGWHPYIENDVFTISIND